MKRLLVSLIILCQFVSTNAQTITGKLVDQTGQGLSELQLKLYISSKTYDATSGTDGSFSFINVSGVKKDDELPTGYEVSNNYPNPFNPKTRIVISLPNSGQVNVSVFNLLGQKVLDDFEKYFSAGTSSIDLELSGLSNGIYLARITLDGKYTVSRKLMLIYGSQHLAASNTIPQQSTKLGKNLTNAILIENVKIDSLEVTGTSIKRNTFTNLPIYSGNNLNLGSLIVNTQNSGTPCSGLPTITYAGKTYNTVQIGTQCWLKENLDVGTRINGSLEQTNNDTIEKYCYNNDVNNCNTYGGLYQWAEAVQYKNGATNTTSPNPAFSGNVQGICPSGWHVPTYAELQTLSTATVVRKNSNTLKALGQGTGSGQGTNTSGFSALLAGFRIYGSYFNYLGYNTFYWSSTETNTNGAYYMFLDNYSSNIYFGSHPKVSGFSVRCAKD